MTTGRAQLSMTIALLLAWTGSAQAETLRIGDADGFGFSSTAGLFNVLGDPADELGDGLVLGGVGGPPLPFPLQLRFVHRREVARAQRLTNIVVLLHLRRFTEDPARSRAEKRQR